MAITLKDYVGKFGPETLMITYNYVELIGDDLIRVARSGQYYTHTWGIATRESTPIDPSASHGLTPRGAVSLLGLPSVPLLGEGSPPNLH